LSLARLRAIENRKVVARSANTGISAFIDTKGRLEKQLPYNQKGVLQGEIPLYNDLTFYAQYGDYLARWAGFLAVLYFFIALSGRLKNKV
jgi:apolipoprotein N-acyltransferase